MKYDVFISYSRKDTAIADQICEAFDKVGISYFIDKQGIVGSGEFPEILADAILESQFFLFLASKNSYSSKFTKKEIFFAFNEKQGGTLFPYIIDDSILPNAIKLVFSDIHILSIKTHPIETKLVNDILHLLGRTRPEAESTQQPKQEKFAVFSAENESELKAQKKDGKFGFVNKQGKIVIPFEYEGVGSFSEGLANVKREEKWGFIDKLGRTVIPFELDYAEKYSEGIACVKKDGRYGFINQKGVTIIPFKYGIARSFSEGLACVKEEGKWGFIDKLGASIIPFEYVDAHSFSEGLASVKKEEKWGFINKQSATIIPFKYDDTFSFSNGKAYAKIDKNWGAIDKQGNVVVPFDCNLLQLLAKDRPTIVAGLSEITQQFITGLAPLLMLNKLNNKYEDTQDTRYRNRID